MMKLVQLFYVDEKFVHPLFSRYTTVGGRRGTPQSSMRRGTDGEGDDHIIEEFMDKQIWDDQPAPFSQASEEDEEQDGLGENEEDGRDDSEQAEGEDDVVEERDNSDSEDMDARVIQSEETSSEINSDQYDSEKEDDNDV
jgi:hypothetical protein